MIEYWKTRRTTHPFAGRLHAPGLLCCSVVGCMSRIEDTRSAVAPHLIASRATIPNGWSVVVNLSRVTLRCPNHPKAALVRPCGRFRCSVCGLFMPGDPASVTMGPREVAIYQAVTANWGSAMAQNDEGERWYVLLCPDHVNALQAHQEAIGDA